MENNKSYFGEAAEGIKSLFTGMRVTMKEYFTPKVTEQYPENRKTTLHVSARHRGRLVMPHAADGSHKCIACTLCEKACPNGTIRISSEMRETEDGKKKRFLTDYSYDLGDCMFCQLCVNVCPQDAIMFTNDFENAMFERESLVLHLDKELSYEPSLPGIIDGANAIETGTWNTKK